jgi:hypothetical protein
MRGGGMCTSGMTHPQRSWQLHLLFWDFATPSSCLGLPLLHHPSIYLPLPSVLPFPLSLSSLAVARAQGWEGWADCGRRRPTCGIALVPRVRIDERGRGRDREILGGGFPPPPRVASPERVACVEEEEEEEDDDDDDDDDDVVVVVHDNHDFDLCPLPARKSQHGLL